MLRIPQDNILQKVYASLRNTSHYKPQNHKDELYLPVGCNSDTRKVDLPATKEKDSDK
jgi:hypothetical protein